MTERESVSVSVYIMLASFSLSFVPARTFDQESFVVVQKKKKKERQEKKNQSRSALAGEKPADSLESISEPSRPP